MPQTTVIAAFVLGAVLLLLSLVSGGFKIFGAEVSGSAGKAGRVLAFVLGLGLVLFSLGYRVPEVDKPADKVADKVEDKPAEHTPESPAPTNAKTTATTTGSPMPTPVAHSSPRDNLPADLPESLPATSAGRVESPMDGGLPSGYGMQVCGCWGFNPRPVAPEPRCRSGSVRLNWCQAYCPAGGTQYAYVCQ